MTRRVAPRRWLFDARFVTFTRITLNRVFAFPLLRKLRFPGVSRPSPQSSRFRETGGRLCRVTRERVVIVNKNRSVIISLALLSNLTGAPQAQPLPLPPALEWSGPSERLIVETGDRWVTPAERNGFVSTPGYAETRSYLERLVAASPLLKLESYGTSPEGRDLYFVRAHKGEGKKPVVLVQACIHAGEVDGKDAGLMLLRDIALRGKSSLLDKVDLVFVPTYNPDGLEMKGLTYRPHQRGPNNPGSHATAQGINLNRDYAKADAPETKAMLRLLQRLEPVLYLDFHASDGFDHGYDVTYTFAGWGRHVQSRAITGWLIGSFTTAVNAHLRQAGHNPHFYPSAFDDRDLSKGLRVAAEGPRYSTGYGDFARIPVVLVEMHHLKPFRQRVLGAYAMMEGALRQASADGDALRSAIETDRADRPAALAVRWEKDPTPLERIPFLGVALDRYRSSASGEDEVRYKAVTQELDLPVYGQKPVQTVTLPRAWWVPASASDVLERLDLHGIRYERLESPRTLKLDVVRLTDPTPGPALEQRIMVRGEIRHETREQAWPKGSIRVPFDQPKGLLAAALLEAESVDSFLSWGFFPSMLQKPPGVERYLSAPMAEEMLEADPDLQAEFQAKLASDPVFAADGAARLEWFVQRSPYWDDSYLLYPIGREL